MYYSLRVRIVFSYFLLHHQVFFRSFVFTKTGHFWPTINCALFLVVWDQPVCNIIKSCIIYYYIKMKQNLYTVHYIRYQFRDTSSQMCWWATKFKKNWHFDKRVRPVRSCIRVKMTHNLSSHLQTIGSCGTHTSFHLYI